MSPLLTPAATAPGTSHTRAARPRVSTSHATRPTRRSAPKAEVLPQDLGLGQLFLHTRDAIVVANIDSGRIVLWNPAAQQLFGYTPAEAIGQPMDMLIPPAIARLHHEALAHYRRTDEGALINSQRPMEVPAITKSGDEIRVELSLLALDERPAPRHYVMALLRDASERKRVELQALEAARAESARAEAERALEEHNQLISSGLTALADPVARLMRSAARLARAASDLEGRHIRALARVVEARAQVVQRITQHVVDATAVQTATMELQAERVNLVPLVNHAVAAARARSSVHKLNVAVPQGLTALVDSARIEQVLDALIDQAMRRNPRGCWIDVDLRRPLVGLAQLEVRDYGRAVSAEEQQELLETNGPTHGLAVTRWVIQQHGGSITLESPDEGGLRIIVTLPTQRRRIVGG